MSGGGVRMKKRIFATFICMLLAVLIMLPGKQVKGGRGRSYNHQKGNTSHSRTRR